MGVSVTKRVKEIAQPKDGYINIKEFEKRCLSSKNELNQSENINAGLVGMAVDYLTRFILTNNIYGAFCISREGAKKIGELEYADMLLEEMTATNCIEKMGDDIIRNACQLVGYDVCFRNSVNYYKPVKQINPDKDTIFNIREMVKRALEFFNQYGPMTKEGFTFGYGYTDIINSGDGDFLTKDTLWDFKVSTKTPDKNQTLQILIYYLMGKHSNLEEFDSIKYIGIYNPRLNVVYRYDMANLSKDIRREVEKDIIGYKTKF